MSLLRDKVLRKFDMELTGLAPTRLTEMLHEMQKKKPQKILYEKKNSAAEVGATSTPIASGQAVPNVAH